MRFLKYGHYYVVPFLQIIVNPEAFLKAFCLRNEDKFRYILI
jgi:hypothetical protein